MVGLAKRLEGKPFHLLATHCQRNPKQQVLDYLATKDFNPNSPNFTVTSFGGHPKVKGNGHVPYYMVFNHHGDLVHHHMGGQWHGGDGLKMIEWVDKLLKEAPAFYLGRAPFPGAPKLAQQIEKKKFPTALKKLDRALLEDEQSDERKEDVRRLYDLVEAYRDATLKDAEARVATAPGTVMPSLKALQKEMKGTTLQPGVDAKIKELEAGGILSRSVKLEAAYSKTILKSKRSDELKIIVLEKLLQKEPNLPYSKIVRAKLEELKSR